MTFQLDRLHEGRGDFLDRLGRRAQPPYPVPAHQLLGLVYLPAAVFRGRILAVGTTFLSNLGQSFGGNRQAKELGAMATQSVGQAIALEILWNQGVVSRLDAELQRQVQAGRRLATARDTDKDDVRLV